MDWEHEVIQTEQLLRRAEINKGDIFVLEMNRNYIILFYNSAPSLNSTFLETIFTLST